MQGRKARHLIELRETPPTERPDGKPGHFGWLGLAPSGVPFEKPPELTWRDYAIMLLHIASSIEHALMVQYLYAAYSLGGDQVPRQYWKKVEGWRDNILAVAKEEMGHLLTVQNILALLGGPIEFDREDYPWDSEFYPAPFALAPLSLDTLSVYVYAEMPENWGGQDPDEQDKIIRRARKTAKKLEDDERRAVTRVGVIYQALIAILADHKLLPDEEFDPDSVAVQASWDEWGRGYRAGVRDADLRVDVVTTRDDALVALHRIANQGESPDAAKRAVAHYSREDIPPAALRLRRRLRREEEKATEPAGDGAKSQSHFDRFLEIYRDLDRLSNADPFDPARNVIRNPTVKPQSDCDQITDPYSAKWGNLFNLRYRMLLAYLSHAMLLARQGPDGEPPTTRGAVMHRVFAEMYNLKTIAGILVRRPAKVGHSDGPRAGPPFQMPYALVLPAMPRNRWRLHRDLIEEAGQLKQSLLGDGESSEQEKNYLAAMGDIDAQARRWLDRLIGGVRGALQ